MDYEHLSPKALHKRLIGSLSLRVFYVALFLLIVPLFFHTIIMYHAEYKQTVIDYFDEISILASSQANSILTDIKLQLKTLDTIANTVDFESQNATNFFENDANKYLNQTLQITQAKQIFYLSYKAENNLLCIASSDKSILGENFATKLDFFDSLKTMQNIFVEKTSNLLFICKTIFSKTTNSAEGLLIASFDPSLFIQEFLQIKDFPEKVDMSLLTNDGKVIASSNTSLIGQKENEGFHMIAVTFVPGYFLQIQKEKHLAVKMHLGKVPLYLIIDVLREDIVSFLRKQYFVRFGSLFLVLLFFGGGGTFWFIRRISLPLDHLLATMSQVSKGDIRKKYLPDKMGFEINYLGMYFNDVVENMLKNQQEAEKQKLEKQVYAQELKIGHTIQKEMLPKQHPDFPGLDIASGYFPAKEVSGDFYDLFKIDEDHLMIVIADTAGKGISACFYSLNIRSIFRSFALSSSNLFDMMNLANDLFSKDTKESGIFVTAWVGIFNKKTNQIQYASAGHYPAFVKRKNEIIELSTQGPALGVEMDKKIPVRSFQLEKEDFLVLYTDGILDTMNEAKEIYGLQRLREHVKEINPRDSYDVVKFVMGDLNLFSQTKDQYDDITLVVIRLLSAKE